MTAERSLPEVLPERLLRIGMHERDAAAAALSEHFAAARLDHTELDARLEAAYAARTRVDLERLFVDLPEPAPFRPGRQPAPSARTRAAGPVRRRWAAAPIAPLLFALVVLSLYAGIPPFFAIPLMFWWMSGRRGRPHGRAVHTGR